MQLTTIYRKAPLITGISILIFANLMEKKGKEVKAEHKEVKEAQPEPSSEYLGVKLPPFVKRHRNAISLILSLILVCIIFYGAFSVRMTTSQQKYLLGADDPYLWSRFTDNLVSGNIPQYDNLRLWPEPETFIHSIGFLPYIGAYTYQIYHAISGVDLYRFYFYFSPFYAALAVFPAFWIGRELHSNKAGIFTAFFMGFTPSFLFRSMGGYYDTDCVIMFTSMMVVALFLAAYNRVDTKNWKKPAPIILAALAGIFLTLFAMTWYGFAYMPWLFAGLFGLHWLYIVFISEGKDYREKLKNSWLFFRSHLMVYATLFIFFFLSWYVVDSTTHILGERNPVAETLYVTRFFQTAKAEGGIFPNVWISISEEMSASFDEVVGRVHPVIFGFGVLGLIFLLVMFLQNFKKPSIYPETFFFLTIWTLPMLYGSFWAVRFTQMLAVPLAICAGLAIGVLFDVFFKLDRFISNKGLAKKIAIGLSAVFVIFLLYSLVFADFSPYKTSEAMSKSFGSGVTIGWDTSMAWLKENSAECSVVATYWDPGYLIASLSERRTIYDGGTQNNMRTTPVEELNGLDCMKDRQGYIKEINGKSYCITSRMQDMAGSLYTSDEVKAAKILESYLGNCTEMYFLASNDLIGKSQWWTYFSNWDPEQGKGTAYPYSVSGFSGKKDLMLDNGSALTYGPFYIKVTSKEGKQKIEPLLLQQGRYFLVKNLVFYENNSALKLEFPDGQVQGTLWLSPDFNYAIYMAPQTENSMFTRMFFFEGEGFKYFDKVYSNPEIKIFKLNLEKLRKDYPEVN